MTAQVEQRVATPPAQRRGRATPWLALAGAIIVVLAVGSPPIDAAVDRSFSLHMAQHMVLMNVVAPLLAIAWPLYFGASRTSRFEIGMNGLARPAPALLISTAALWFWHIPALYDIALDNVAVHLVEHVVFLGAFVLFWRPLIPDGFSGGQLRSNEARVLYLTIGMLAAGLLAAVITFADHPLYPHYVAAAGAGRSPLADQRLGGAIMWLVGAVVIVGALLVTMREDEEPAGESTRLDIHVAPDGWHRQQDDRQSRQHDQPRVLERPVDWRSAQQDERHECQDVEHQREEPGQAHPPDEQDGQDRADQHPTPGDARLGVAGGAGQDREIGIRPE